jgi:hypothetical protein
MMMLLFFASTRPANARPSKFTAQSVVSRVSNHFTVEMLGYIEITTT